MLTTTSEDGPRGPSSSHSLGRRRLVGATAPWFEFFTFWSAGIHHRFHFWFGQHLSLISACGLINPAIRPK